MNSFGRTVCGVLIGGWTLLAFCDYAAGQSSNSAPGQGMSSRPADWQQRVDRRRQRRQRLLQATSYDVTAPKTSPMLKESKAVPDDPQLDPQNWGKGANGPTGLQDPGPAAIPETLDPGYPVAPQGANYPGGGHPDGYPGGGCGCSQHSDTCGGQCGGGADCGGGCYDCGGGGCSGGGCGILGACGLGNGGCGGSWLQNFSFLAGVHGFKNSVDQGRNGNFGFQEGINLGTPLGLFPALGFQVGVETLQSNFYGSQVAAGDTGGHDQVFFTTGIFRRAVCGGLQWGVVFDMLHDSYYLGSNDLKQIRAELAFVRPNCREIGFWTAVGTSRDRVFVDNHWRKLEPTDLFAFFYRRYFCGGGQGRLWVGFTGSHDALFGGNSTLPLGESWALQGNFTFVLPDNGSSSGGQTEEAWNVGMQLVWYPGRPAACVRGNPYHPLFDVANNGTFVSALR